jgi:hypothetical protein
MRKRLKQITHLVMLVGAMSLIGCATQALSTSQWGISKGFQRVDLRGKEYFCRLEPTRPPSHLSTVNCLTMAQLRDFRTAIEVTPLLNIVVSDSGGSSPER